MEKARRGGRRGEWPPRYRDRPALGHYEPENTRELHILATILADRTAIAERDYLDPPAARDFRRPNRAAPEADNENAAARAVPSEMGRMAAAVRDYLRRQDENVDLGLPGFWPSCPGVICERASGKRVTYDASAGDRLMARLVADRAAAWREHHELDCQWLALPKPKDARSEASLEARMRRLTTFIDALDEAIAALKPRTEDEALVAAFMLAQEILDCSPGSWRRGNVEMLARGLLDWHMQASGKTPKEVLGGHCIERPRPADATTGAAAAKRAANA